jgi:PAS domain S-box-containing protein
VKIDIYTFAIALGIIYFIQFIIFSFEYYFHKNFKGPGWWLLWSGAAILGFISIQTRQINSLEHISILVQNVMHILTYILLYIGIMRFLGRRERLNLLIVIFVLYVIPFSYYVFIDDDLHIRTILIWTTVALITSVSAYDLYLYREKSIQSALNICLVVFLFHALFSAIKVFFLLTGSRINQVDSQLFINTSSYFEILTISIFWTYALIVMINQRLTSEMERAKNRFEVIFNTTPDAILITDLSDGVITSVNDRYYDLSGYSAEESIGKSTLDLKLWANEGDRMNLVSLLAKNGYCVDFEFELRNKDRTVRSSMMSCRIMNLNDQPQIISLVRDMTERKAKEDEVINQNIQLKRIDAEKDKFFSIIAHDLKGPFSSFLGLTEIMADEIPNLPLNEVIHLAARMRDSARNLHGLLNNLLEWSLIKQGLTHFEPALITLYPEVKESILAYQDPSQKKYISVDITVKKEEMVYADLNMLSSLIRNLLSNAIKYTPEGGSIVIAAETLTDNSCLISVRDSGIGISKSMLDLLFKIDTNTSRKGTNGELSCGLGLLLCKEFVSRHNGEIWVESAEGKGSTFFVKLPKGSA